MINIAHLKSPGYEIYMEQIDEAIFYKGKEDGYYVWFKKKNKVYDFELPVMGMRVSKFSVFISSASDCILFIVEYPSKCVFIRG